ncbi:MAG TPA: GIY-YIG nuclease family protein [Anaerolineales bacterium]|nr:GIY-YIG nuclease family protein [Anaerolineales bacterium]
MASQPSQPLIRNYGLFWEKSAIFWGKGSQAGSLLGKLATARKDGNVDFRDQMGIYVLYSEYKLIYVGQTDKQGLLHRLRQHTKDDLADRWDRFSWFGLRKVNTGKDLAIYVQKNHVETGDVLNHIEAILIHTGEPPLNRQGGKFGKKVEKYLQVRDTRL